MKKNYILLIITLFVVLISGCIDNTASVPEKQIRVIGLTVDAPFSSATLTIYVDTGDIIYEATSPETGIEGLNDSAKITRDQSAELVNLINNNNFFSFEDSYRNENVYDATTYTIVITKGNQIKSVSCYVACPENITEIRLKIEEIWDKDILNVGV